MQVLDFIRGLVRPIISLTIIALISFIAVVLVKEFANQEMANIVIGFVIGAGSTIMTFLYVERAIKPKGER